MIMKVSQIASCNVASFYRAASTANFMQTVLWQFGILGLQLCSGEKNGRPDISLRNNGFFAPLPVRLLARSPLANQRGRISQGANQPRGEPAEAKKPDTSLSPHTAEMTAFDPFLHLSKSRN